MDTMRSFDRSNRSIDRSDIFKNTQSSALKELIHSRVELKNKPVLGKNAPPKLPLNRPKAIPSIPSNTVAPPEDKTMTMTTFQNSHDLNKTNEPSNNGFTMKGPRQSDYLTTIEKGNNPNVGPGSYDPIFKPKL